jgi:hypothetical protein
MKLRIESDGTSRNTKVVDRETGEELEGVTNIEWSLGISDLSRCVIHLHCIPLVLEDGNFKSYELKNENSSS